MEDMLPMSQGISSESVPSSRLSLYFTTLNDFIIGTGYHEGSKEQRDFAFIWYNTIRRYAPFPKRIAVISTRSMFPITAAEVFTIMGDNLGHTCENTTIQLNGWSASLVACALIAYNCKADLIYLEQDTLAFGKWVEKAYEDLGDRDVIHGPKHQTDPFQACSVALTLIKFGFLLEFVRRYLSLMPDSSQLPELKYQQMKKDDPNRFAELSFGVDRERPIPWDQPIWYAQKFTDDEMKEMRKRGLI